MVKKGKFLVLTLADFIRMGKDYGLETLAIMLIATVVYLFAKGHVDLYVFKKKRNITNPKKNPENIQQEFDDSVVAILNSEFFRNLKFKISVDIPTATFSNDHTLDMVYTDLMLSLFTSFEKILTEKTSAIKKDAEWVKVYLDGIYLIIDEYDKEARNRGIPSPIISDFKIWFSPFIYQIYHYVVIIDTNVVGGPVEKIRIFLLALELILVNAMSQLESLEVFGEKYTGVEYRGKVIGSGN